MPQKKLKIFDIFIIAGVLVLVLLAFLPKLIPHKGGKELVVISESGESRYSLAGEKREIELVSRGTKLKIVIGNGEAYILSSECPGGICMNASPVRKNGDTTVCAPAGVALIVRTGGDSDADALAG